jgi:hypothetical protein
MEQTTFEPRYQADIGRLADAVRTTHGPAALDFAVETLHRHLRSTAWKNCALWMQIVNRLNGAQPVS